MNANRGVYLILFSNGLVKIGMTSGLKGRIAAHRSEAERWGHSIIDVAERPVATEDQSLQVEETIVFRFGKVATECSGREYFRGVDFHWAIEQLDDVIATYSSVGTVDAEWRTPRFRDLLRSAAVKTHGVITIPVAEELGVPAVELRKLAYRGCLTRIGHGVYRMEEVAPTPISEYAEAAALAGPQSVIAYQSVLAFYELCLVNPVQIHVVSPFRVRATLPPTVRLTRGRFKSEDVRDVHGVSMQSVAAALSACRPVLLSARYQDGVKESRRRRLISDYELSTLL